MFETTKEVLELARTHLFLNKEVRAALKELEIAQARLNTLEMTPIPGDSPANFKAVVKKGVRTRRQKAATSRFGEGKIHLLVYSREIESWYRACEGPHKPDPYGIPQPESEPLTCKLCLATGLA